MSAPLYIFDLDGTLALNKHREHFIKRPHCNYCSGAGFVEPQQMADSECPVCNYPGAPKFKPDWKSYFEACVDDSPNLPAIATLGRLYRADCDI